MKKEKVASYSTLDQMIPRFAALPLVLAATVAGAANPERGRLLYENYCYHCHMTEIHFRLNSRIDTWDRLRHSVRIWQGEMKLGWGEEDVTDVAGFLNERFYRLPQVPAAED